MKCPHCGFTGSDEATACQKCGRDLTGARDALGLPSGGRLPRATTSILDGPVDPSLIDDAPPAPEKPTSSSILDLEAELRDALGGGAPGSPAGEQTDLEEILAGTDAVEPGEIAVADGPRGSGTQARAAVPGAPRPGIPTASTAVDVIDFGEPLDGNEGPPPAIPTRQESWDEPEDEWGGIDGEIQVTSDPRALPKGGFWLRVVASIADSIFIQIISSMVFFVVATWSGAMAVMASHVPSPGADPSAAAQEIEQALLPFLTGPLGWTFLALVTLASLYRPFCHWRWGKTLGKKLVGLRVVTTDGERLGFVRACWRDIAYLIASLPLGLGLLWVAWDPQKQGWHDKMAGTYVLKENT